MQDILLDYFLSIPLEAAELIELGSGLIDLITGQEIYLDVDGGVVKFTLNDISAVVTEPDVDGCAGESIIHRIDAIFAELPRSGAIAEPPSSVAPPTPPTPLPGTDTLQEVSELSASPKSGASSDPAMIGGGIAAVVLVCAVAAFIFIAFRRRRSKKQTKCKSNVRTLLAQNIEQLC